MASTVQYSNLLFHGSFCYIYSLTIPAHAVTIRMVVWESVQTALYFFILVTLHFLWEWWHRGHTIPVLDHRISGAACGLGSILHLFGVWDYMQKKCRGIHMLPFPPQSSYTAAVSELSPACSPNLIWQHPANHNPSLYRNLFTLHSKRISFFFKYIYKIYKYELMLEMEEGSGEEAFVLSPLFLCLSMAYSLHVLRKNQLRSLVTVSC